MMCTASSATSPRSRGAVSRATRPRAVGSSRATATNWWGAAWIATCRCKRPVFWSPIPLAINCGRRYVPTGSRSTRSSAMSHVVFGLAAGLVFGILAVGLMLPLQFPDKRAALTAAFLDRFAIGFVIGVIDLSWPRWIVGVAVGLLLSAPSAVITKAWRPILGIGAIGGLIIALIMPHVVR